MRKKYLYTGLVIYGITIALLLAFSTKSSINANRLTAACLSSQFPAVEFSDDGSKSSATEASRVADNEQSQSEGKTSVTDAESVPEAADNSTPKVLIYHSHATESYLPTSSGNFHTVEEANTVRDAGNVMTEVLQRAGIGVIHDKTLHDNPSYDGSYYRSSETVTRILAKYPSIKCIIDLHRDATAAKIDGPTRLVNGKTCAVYSYVLGNKAGNAGNNKAFLSKLNNIASSDFGGFTGEILDRPYGYNQGMCSIGILLELGNNRNNIGEVRESARIFGEILAKALKE